MTSLLEFGLRLGPSEDGVTRSLRQLREEKVVERLWDLDHTLWSTCPDDVVNRLGWLDAPLRARQDLAGIDALVAELRAEGIRHGLIIGMGGASLASDVFQRLAPAGPGGVDMSILDTTHPDGIREHLDRLDPEATVVLFSMKKWALEAYSLMKLVFSFFRERIGAEAALARFIAITDEGAWVAPYARRHGMRRVLLNDPYLGGRYAALSYVGLLPAALHGVDVDSVLARAADARSRCLPAAERAEPFGSLVAAALGSLHNEGRDKLAIVTPPSLAGWGDWVEQLIAESTGKSGKGILPLVQEAHTHPATFGHDRAFAVVHLGDDAATADIEARLVSAGQSVLSFRLGGPADVGGLIYLWEFAVAVAGHIMGIHAFDQPNVEATKQRTADVLDGRLTLSAGDLEARAAADVTTMAAAADVLRAFVDARPHPSYLALQAYLPPLAELEAPLAALRQAVSQVARRPVTLGYGPRFLHSTGQLHKGDAGAGRFIQLVAPPQSDLAIPADLTGTGSEGTFGRLIAAQADGDAIALRQGGRAVLRLELREVSPGLISALAEAL